MNKNKRKISDTLIITYLLTFVLIFVGQILGILLELLPITSSSDAWITGTLYAECIGVWLLTVLYMGLTKKNRPILKEIGTAPSGNNIKFFLLGILLGFVLNGICILIAWLHKDIYLYYDGFRPISFVLILVAVFIQSSSEELLCRGFMYQRLLKSYSNPLVAIIGNAIFFALLHLLNDGVTILSILNIFLSGIMFTLIVYYFDSLWCAMAAHTAWNFTQNIIFGLPNSGIVLPYSVFKLDASTAVDSFAYNVGFGIEGTIMADIVLLAACIVLYLWGSKYAASNRRDRTEEI